MISALIYYHNYEGLKIVGHEASVPHGSSVHLNCSTDLAADTIEWLNAKGTVLKNGNGPLLQLTDTPSDDSNTVYVCRINSKFGSQNKTAIVHILQEEMSPSGSSIVIPIIVVIAVAIVVVVIVIIVILLMR